MELSKARKIFSSILKEHNLPNLTLGVYENTEHEELALTYYNEFKPLYVDINRKFLNFCSEEEIIEILKHEAAHVHDIVLRGKSNHDNQWVKLAKFMGIENPSSRIDIEYKKGMWGYSVSCSKCNHIIEYTDDENLVDNDYKKRYICPKCYSDLELKGIE